MGADGHIDIWRADKVHAVWPDCDNLFQYLPNAYLHYLDGKGYYHLYLGDDSPIHWEHEGDWYVIKEKCSQEFLDRMRSFVDWLIKNVDATWEVWT